MIRPEVKYLLWKWHEACIGAVLVCIGLYSGLTQWGVARLWGGGLIVLGLLFCHMGIIRAKFRRQISDAGLITVTEGEISYSGPFHGAKLSLESLSQISLTSSNQIRQWRLLTRNREMLTIPTNAAGSERLMDAFALLPDVNLGKFASALQKETSQPILLWKRAHYRHSADDGD